MISTFSPLRVLLLIEMSATALLYFCMGFCRALFLIAMLEHCGSLECETKCSICFRALSVPLI